MGFADEMLASALMRRLRQNAEANARGEIAGRNIGGVPVLGGLANGVGKLPIVGEMTSPVALANAVGLGFEGTGNVGRALTGAMLAQMGRIAERTPLDEIAATPGVGQAARTIPIVGDFARLAQIPGFLDAARQAQQGQDTATGNPFERAIAANEAGASGNEKLVGGINAVYDPGNAVGALGKVAQARRLSGLAEALLAVDKAQALPFEAAATLAKGAGRMGAPVAREAAERVAAAFRHTPEDSARLATKTGGVAQSKIPKVGGRKQYGPIPPPELATPTPIRPEVAIEPPASAPLTPDGNASVPALDRLRDFMRAEEARVGTVYQPNDPTYFQRKAGIEPAELPSLFEQLVSDGTLGRQPDGGLALRPTSPTPKPREVGVPELPDVDPDEIPADALSAADETAARAAWEGAGDTLEPATLRGGDFSSDELDTLVNLAYPVERAQANAISKYTNPDDLANAAITRITTSPSAVKRLAAQDPILAEKVAYRDLPGEQAMPDVAEEVTLSPLPRSQGGDMAAGGGMMLVTPFAAAPAIGRAAKQAFAPDTTLGIVGRHALEQGRAEQRAANAALSEGKTRLLPGLRDMVDIWRSNTVTHPKNLIQDEGSGRLFLAGAGGKGASDNLAPIRQQYAERLKAATPWEREPALVQDPLAAIGKSGYVPKLGDSLAQAEKGLAAQQKVRSTTQEALGSAALSVLNPSGFATSALGVAASGTLGSVRPAIRGAFRGINDFQQATFRRAAFADELDTTLGLAADTILPRLEAAGADVSSLAGRAGKFSPDELAAIAGPQAGDQWRALADRAVTLAEDRAKFIFGDYSRRSGFERALGGVVPFASWAIRAYPVAVEMAARHPGVALAVYKLLEATSGDAGKDGRPGYTAGMIPFTTETPLIGPIARVMLGGQSGTAYADPIGAFSPVGGDAFAPEEGGEKNWYQSANAFLGRVGLPQANPAVQAGAYALGLDYKAPGSLSRTQGLENALALIPGNPQLPDLGGGILRTARGTLSPLAEAAGLPGAKGDKSPDQYDPITRRYAELVLAETKKPLNDQSNRAYLVGMSDPTNELMMRARREVLLGGAARNASSLTNPIGTVAQGQGAREAKAAKDNLPFKYEEIQRMQAASPYLAAQMKARNAAQTKANPAVNTYAISSRGEATETLVREWEGRHEYLRRVSPAIYQQRRAAYLASLR